MKIVSSIFLLSFISFCSYAQPELDRYPKDDKIKQLRIQYITDNIKLSNAQAEKFWPVFNELSDKREDLRQQLRILHMEADMNYISKEKADDIFERYIQLRQKEVTLEKEYFTKLKAIIDIEQIVRLIEVEHSFKRTLLKHLQQRGQGRHNPE